MVNDIQLFIGGEEVEFSTTPQILYNYALKEVQNPSVIKNSFSKSLEIPSTPQNDNIFNHYWNLQRYQGENTTFNALEKVPFQLFFQGSLIEKGYVKLDSTKQANHTGSYSVSLYGGLGNFFYNLSYMGSEAKRSLSTLQFINDSHPSEPNLNFRINKENVNEAWQGILGYGASDDRWNVINFAPAYNGIPSDFSAENVLINHRNASSVIREDFTDSGVTYTPIVNGSPALSGYTLGEASAPMTEWETFDLRSYLQRPVLSVKRTLEAIFNPANNGGYQVKLDSHFFNTDNPYYNDAWMTLPMLRDLELKGGDTQTVYGGSVNYLSRNGFISYWRVNYGTIPTLSKINNANLDMKVTFTPQGSTAYSTLFGIREVEVSTGIHIFDGYHWVRRATSNTGVICQLQALDATGKVVAASDAYVLGGGEYASFYGVNSYNFPEDGNSPQKYNYIAGKWVKQGSKFYFADESGQPLTIHFNLNTDAVYSTLRIKTQWKDRQYYNFAWNGTQTNINLNATQGAQYPLYTQRKTILNGNYTVADVISMNRVLGSFGYEISAMEVSATDYEALFSDTYIPKSKLLGTSYSPAEFLLSYAKQFGLYFYVDPSEEADDTSLAPAGVIHILDRDSYYTDDYVDIEQRIDRGQNMTITPVNAQSKWYEFSLPQIDSEAANIYKEKYGSTYGRQLVNTNYNFDDKTTPLLDTNIFKSGIMVREKGKYYYQPIDGVPYYLWNGFKEYFFNGEDTYENDWAVRKFNYKNNLNNLGLTGYDSFPKLQCHTEDNSPSDGSGVLLFYNGALQMNSEAGQIDYWLTDDVSDMAFLNEDTPCWILTWDEYDAASQRIAYRYNQLPYFTRDIVNFGLQEGNIVHSWNFGHPQAIYSPNTYTTDGDCIYDKMWKDYINDFYNINSRKVDCYARLPFAPHPSLLRKWWYFDGGIWVLNEIKDWNIAQDKPVLCSFIKVQDVSNYSLERITPAGKESITLSQYSIDCSGGTITGTIYLQSGGGWFSRDSQGVVKRTDESGNTAYFTGCMRPYTGRGTTSNFSVAIPANTGTSNYSWEIAIQDDYDNWLTATILQSHCGSSPIEQMDVQWRQSSVNVTSADTSVTLYYDATGTSGYNIGVTDEGGWITRFTYDDTICAVTAYFSQNVMNTPRSARLKLWVTNTGSQSYPYDYLDLTQAAGVSTLEVSKSAITWTYPAVAGVFETFDISANTQWTASVDTADFAVLPLSGNGDRAACSALTMTAPNTTYTAKTGTITITDGITTKTISLTKKTPPYTTPSLRDRYFTGEYQTIDFQVESDFEFAFSGLSNVSEWLHIYNNDTQREVASNDTFLPGFDAPANGFKLVLSENNTGAERTCTIWLKHWLNDSGTMTPGSVVYTISIAQDNL